MTVSRLAPLVIDGLDAGRSDVFFASIHADPSFAYPHYLGFADERGEGAGEDVNLNLPLPRGTDWTAYAPVLDTALQRVEAFGADVLLVSLGMDTFAGDPISHFRLETADYGELARRIASLSL